ncbi:GIY-YIG nuclease family protein [Clostridium botulinum]|nr:GIY-YIG nuclease family protein [Clostridium botulinum]
MGTIYKIINKINNKVYIGYTSKDIQVRFKQHLIASRYNKKNNKRMTILNKAIIKYGEDNFKIEKITDVEDKDWPNKEKYYINLFNSRNINYGYNIAEGGENPPKAYGEKNIRASLSDDDYLKIIKMLNNYDFTMTEISKNFNVENSTIERINKGEIRYNEKLTYPIRKYDLFQNKALIIIELLIHTDLSYKEISKLTDCVKTTPMEINSGHSNANLISNLRFPIRNNIEYNKNVCKKPNISEEQCIKIKFDSFVNDNTKLIKFKIIQEILYSELNLTEISTKFNCRTDKVSRINTGEFSKRELGFLKFPLNKNKIYNINVIDRINAVETIPLIGE